eukprot:s3175_g4.t1
MGFALSLGHYRHWQSIFASQCAWPCNARNSSGRSRLNICGVASGSWNLTDQDAVDELVHLFELDERPIRPSMWGDRESRRTVASRMSNRQSTVSKGPPEGKMTEV